MPRSNYITTRGLVPASSVTPTGEASPVNWDEEDQDTKDAIHLLSGRLEDASLNSFLRLRRQLDSELKDAWQELNLRQSDCLNERDALGGVLKRVSLLKEMSDGPQSDHYFKEAEEIALTRALKNVSHVLQYMRFLREVPQMIKDTSGMLDDILVGAGRRGNANALYEAHGNVRALERMRNLTLSNTSKADKWAREAASMFKDVEKLRFRIDSIVFEEVFANLISVAKSDPRILVAGIRVVADEQKEDEWWEQQLLQAKTLKDSQRNGSPYSARSYRSKCLETIKKSIANSFKPPSDERPTEYMTDNLNITDKAVEAILTYADSKVEDLALVQQYVVPCFPEDYKIGDLFVSEYYTHIMLMISKEVAKSEDIPLSRLGKHSIVRWYSRYKAHLAHIGIISTHIQTIFSRCDCCAFPALPSIPYSHSSSVSSCISLIRTSSELRSGCLDGCSSGLNSNLSGTHATPLEFEKWADHVVDYLRETLSRRILALIRSDTDTHEGKLTSVETSADDGEQKSTQLPEALFSTVESEVRDVTLLCDAELVARFGATAAKSLMNFIRELKAVLSGREPYSLFLNMRESSVIEYYCATMNNMTRCIDYTEEIRDRLVARCGQSFQSAITEAYGKVVGGFRSVVKLASEKLMAGIESDLKPITRLFYQSTSGTEVMLDALQTLNDCLTEYRQYLMPRHFEELVILCCQTLVAHYLRPFLEKKVTLKTSAVVAQTEKDAENLMRFLQANLTLCKKFLPYIVRPIEVTQNILTCKSNTVDMVITFCTWREVLSMNKRTKISLPAAISVLERLWKQRGIQERIIYDTLAIVRSEVNYSKDLTRNREARWKLSNPMVSRT